MLRFSRFEIQLKPNQTALELYAPDWETAEKTEEYQRLLADNQPRSLRIKEHPYWCYDGERGTRNATPEEIPQWINEPYPRVERHSPYYSYRYFGDQSVLAPLREKLNTDHAEYMAEWQKAYVDGGNALPFEKLREIAIVNTVYGNMQEAENNYSTEYMAALAEEEHPLRILAFFYRQSGVFAIEQTTADMLGMLECQKYSLATLGEIDADYQSTGDRAGRMELLNRNLDRELSLYESRAWQGLSFEETCEKAMEMFTLRQLHQSLRYGKSAYSAEQLDLLAQFKYPMGIDKFRIIGERDLCKYSLDELNGILPKMFPDVQPTPDIWDTNTAPTDSAEPDEETEEQIAPTMSL